jgi:hypothetical protein
MTRITGYGPVDKAYDAQERVLDKQIVLDDIRMILQSFPTTILEREEYEARMARSCLFWRSRYDT